MKHSPMPRGKPLARGKGLARTGRVAAVNPKRKRARRAVHHGTKRRSQWFRELPCACMSAGRPRHRACSGPPSDPSHTRHFPGDTTTIISQSRGCHDYIGTKTWAVWEAETGVDRHALASLRATQGPDAPLPTEDP